QANNQVEIPDPADTSKTLVAALGWVETLSHVRPFLKQSGLTYEELLRLLATRLLNPAGNIRIEAVAGADPNTCDTHLLQITNLNAAVLDRIHQFVRLWRSLGWSIRELDLAIEVFQGSVADPNARLSPRLIEQLAVVKRLHDEFEIPLDRLLALWGGIDTRRGPSDDPAGQDSLYDKLFLNPSVLKPVDATFTLNAARNDLAQGGELIANHEPGAFGGLGITATELTELMAVEAPGGILSLANLSALFRWAVLAGGMGIPVGECTRWKSLTGADPFAAAHPEDTLEFVHAIKEIVDAGFTVDEVDYLLRHQQPPGDPLTPAVETVAQLLTEMRNELQEILDGLVVEPDVNGEVTRRYLGLLKWDPAHVELVVSTLNSLPAFSQATFLNAVRAFERPVFRTPLVEASMPAAGLIPRRLKGRFFFDRKNAELCFSGLMLGQDREELIQIQGVDPIFRTAVGQLHTLSQQFVPVGANIFLDAAAATALLAAGTTPPGRFPPLFDAYTRLSKAMLIATRLRMTARQIDRYSNFLPTVPQRDVRWTLAAPVQAGWLDLNTLPVAQNANSVPALVTRLQRLVQFCRVRDQLGGNGEIILEEILSAARRLVGNSAALTNEVAAILKRRAGWEETDTVELIGPSGLALSLPNQLLDETGPALLVRARSLARRINAGAAQARNWARDTPAASSSFEIKQALRARHGDDAWQRLAAPAQDLLREKKRAALVAYLTVRPVNLSLPDGTSMPAWHDANGLFAYFLIDVEMSPCWKTSRIKQALSSVQLFVQRCLLHLENGVRIDVSKDDAWLDWKWMKNYRVWEAK